MIKQIIATLILLVACFSPATALAQERMDTQMIRVSPVIFNISLSPGAIQTYTATVENLLSVPLPVDISLNDFEATDEKGGVTYTESRTDPLLSWINLSDRQIILPAKSKREITMEVSLPRKIPVGGYYGVLYFSPVLPGTAGQQTQVAAKVGSILLANIGVPGMQKKAEIIDFSFSRPYFEDSSATFLLRVRNTALHHFTAKPTLILKPLIGKEQEYPVVEKFVFPGKIRRWDEVTNFTNTSPGIYTAIMRVSTGNGEYVTAERLLVLFPVTKALTLLTLLLIAGFLITKRKRLKHALHALIKG